MSRGIAISSQENLNVGPKQSFDSERKLVILAVYTPVSLLCGLSIINDCLPSPDLVKSSLGSPEDSRGVFSAPSDALRCHSMNGEPLDVWRRKWEE